MIKIRTEQIRQAYEVLVQIPELQPAYSWAKWQERLDDKRVIALVAYSNEIAVGCKVGYHTEACFYSWVGGVLSPYRNQGIAKMLADQMEQIAAAEGAQVMRMKTRNRFKGMLHFALGNGFDIIDVLPVDNAPGYDDWRILLEKKI